MSAWRLRATPANGGSIRTVDDLINGKPVISARWRRPAVTLRTGERCQRFVAVDMTAGIGNAPRKWRVFGAHEGVRDSRSEPNRVAVSIPETSRKPSCAGNFRCGFPDFEADFPYAATYCDKYVCLLQHVPERSLLRGNYDNFGIALVSRKGTFAATKMSALITSRSGDCWSRFMGG
jgi:hypothetical protein